MAFCNNACGCGRQCSRTDDHGGACDCREKACSLQNDVFVGAQPAHGGIHFAVRTSGGYWVREAADGYWVGDAPKRTLYDLDAAKVVCERSNEARRKGLPALRDDIRFEVVDVRTDTIVGPTAAQLVEKEVKEPRRRGSRKAKVEPTPKLSAPKKLGASEKLDAPERSRSDDAILRLAPRRLGHYCPHCEMVTRPPEYPKDTEAYAMSAHRNDYTDRHTDGGCWKAVSHENPYECIRVLRAAFEELRTDVDSLMEWRRR